VYDNYPKIYLEKNGKVSGLFADILNFIAVQENWKIDYVSGTFSEGLEKLQKGDIDILVDTAYSKERALLYDFTEEGVLGSWGVVYVRKDSDIETIQDLNEKVLGILKSSVYLEGDQGIKSYFKIFDINVRYVELNEYPEVFQQLDNRKIDAAIVSRIFGLTNVNQYPNLKATNIFFQPTELKFALQKGNPENLYLIERMDYWLKTLKGGYLDIYKNALDKYGLLSAYHPKEIIPKWINYAGIFLILIIVFSTLIIIILKRARKSAIEELRKKELMLENILENIPIFVCVVDAKGIITYFAGKGTGVVQYLPKNVIGKSVSDVFKDNTQVISNYLRGLRGESVNFKSEIANRHWMIHLFPIIEDKSVVSIVAIAFDYSKEAKLDKEKTEFIYLASHHLRTPSTAIKWNLQLLWPKMHKNLTEKELDMWNKINVANNNIISLADTLSTSSWLELSSFSPSPAKHLLSSIIQEELLNLKSNIKGKNIDVSVNYHGVEEVIVDRKRLKTIFGILLVNAIKYTDESGNININTTLTDNNLKISISDTGIGIPVEEQPEIFKKLFRATNAIKKFPNGVGISLYIAKKITENLHGQIWFESEENKGCTFHLELPLTTSKT